LAIPIVNIDVIDSCNSRCQSCHIWKHDNEGEVSLVEYFSLFDQLAEIDTQIISIGGGEPLLRKDICDIIYGASSKGFSVHMNSSLVGVSKSQLDQLVKSGLSFIHVSIDHFKNDKYYKIRGVNSLTHVLSNLEYLKSKKIDIGINVVISKLNYHDLDEIMEWCLAQNISKVQFIIASKNLQQEDMSAEDFSSLALTDGELGDLKKKLLVFENRATKNNVMTNSKMYLNNLKEVNQERRLISCYSGRATITIDPFGFVRTCYAYDSTLSIKKNKILDILNSEKFAERVKQVDSCKKACHDVGSAEISIRMNLWYGLSSIRKIFSEVMRYTK